MLTTSRLRTIFYKCETHVVHNSRIILGVTAVRPFKLTQTIALVLLVISEAILSSHIIGADTSAIFIFTPSIANACAVTIHVRFGTIISSSDVRPNEIPISVSAVVQLLTAIANLLAPNAYEMISLELYSSSHT